MLKRSLTTSLLFSIALAGCATVSVVPGTTSVQASVTQEQSALRLAASSFGDMATTRGWVKQSKGVMSLAMILVEGQSDDASHSQQTYATLIGAHLRDADDIEASILADIKDAADGMEFVSTQAENFISAAPESQTSRRDLVSFERTLVQAQQARRSFIDAMEIIEGTGSFQLQESLGRLEGEIDKARILANKLAKEYASRDENGAIS